MRPRCCHLEHRHTRKTRLGNSRLPSVYGEWSRMRLHHLELEYHEKARLSIGEQRNPGIWTYLGFLNFCFDFIALRRIAPYCHGQLHIAEAVISFDVYFVLAMLRLAFACGNGDDLRI